METLACCYLSLTLVVGLGANATSAGGGLILRLRWRWSIFSLRKDGKLLRRVEARARTMKPRIELG